MIDAVTEAQTTLDAFHRGNFWLVQPARGAHRSGTDALMLAAAVPSTFSGKLADFGAGAGAAGLAVASRCSACKVVLIEKSGEMASYARRTLAHLNNAHLAERADVIEADLTLAGKARRDAGLADNCLDYVIMNPPFNAPRDRATPDVLRKEAHVMEDGLFEHWVRSAAAMVKPRGGLAIIARPQSLASILSALEGRFGNAEIVPVHPRTDAAAIRIILRAVRASRGGLSLKPALIAHGEGREFSQRADDINNGRASLFGD
ncbi:tRNA1(Val) (adenine(37)-N6)-methyltransferase [Foliimonas ilicis]